MCLKGKQTEVLPFFPCASKTPFSSHIFLCGIPLSDNPPALFVGFALLDPRRQQWYKKQRGSRDSLPNFIWSFLFFYHLTTEAFHGMLSCKMSASLFEIGCINWCKWLIFVNKGQLLCSLLGNRLYLPLHSVIFITLLIYAPSVPPGIVFQQFHGYNVTCPNVCLLFAGHYFQFVAWVTWLIQQGPSNGGSTQEKHLWTGLALLTHCDELACPKKELWRCRWHSMQSCPLNRCLKEFWAWKNVRDWIPSVVFYTYSVENLDTPQKQTVFTILGLLSPPPSTHSLLQFAYSSVCVTEPDKQSWGGNA